MNNDVAQLERSNNKYYALIFRYIYIYIYIYDITNLLKKKKFSKCFNPLLQMLQPATVSFLIKLF